MKKGTSAPSFCPIAINSSRCRLSLQSRLSASSTVAASEDPPPRPPPTGSTFSSAMSAPSGAQAQVLVAEGAAEAQLAVLTDGKADAVGALEQPEDRLQLVVAVGAAA